MQKGMMWFDSGSGSLTAKIQRAMERYQTKMGAWPTKCVVHPSMIIPGTPADVKLSNGQQVRILVSRLVLPNNFWVGVE